LYQGTALSRADKGMVNLRGFSRWVAKAHIRKQFSLRHD
jgi:hypothetical protein